MILKLLQIIVSVYEGRPYMSLVIQVSNCIWVYADVIIGIIPEVKLVPEAQPRDTNNRGVLFLLSMLGRNHILMAQSEAEGPNFKKILISVSQIRPKIG